MTSDLPKYRVRPPHVPSYVFNTPVLDDRCHRGLRRGGWGIASYISFQRPILLRPVVTHVMRLYHTNIGHSIQPIYQVSRIPLCIRHKKYLIYQRRPISVSNRKRKCIYRATAVPCLRGRHSPTPACCLDQQHVYTRHGAKQPGEPLMEHARLLSSNNVENALKRRCRITSRFRCGKAPSLWADRAAWTFCANLL
ncbi:hypothetical protein BC834DRAFT_635934 [Gloeopeniophorella convolvens]|nr:hypothetical protein BC834DRAFT_635934 [Gloeopeniophorella convolvens]